MVVILSKATRPSRNAPQRGRTEFGPPRLQVHPRRRSSYCLNIDCTARVALAERPQKLFRAGSGGSHAGVAYCRPAGDKFAG